MIAKIKKLANKKITIKAIEINIIMIFTLFATLFLLSTWPRFLNDALSFPWYFYLVLVGAFAIPVIRIINRLG